MSAFSVRGYEYGYNGYMPGKNDEHLSSAEIRALKRSGQMECETCENRKYQDGSDESDVSFKAPGHISPQSSASQVMAHERMHVANAYEKAGKNNGQVLTAAVTIHTSTCPECGRTYVSGGETVTTIRYNKDNYSQNAKKSDEAAGIVGRSLDMSV